MKFRIKKENGWYFAEYRQGFFWWFLCGSFSRNIEGTRRACEQFEKSKIVEKFKL